MASTLPIRISPLNIGPWLSYAAGLQSVGSLDGPLGLRKAGAHTPPQVATGT